MLFQIPPLFTKCFNGWIWASQMYRCLSKAVLCFQEIDPHGFLMYSIQLPEWVCSKLCNKLLVPRIKEPADEMTATKQNTKHRRYQEAWEAYVAAYGLQSRSGSDLPSDILTPSKPLLLFGKHINLLAKWKGTKGTAVRASWKQWRCIQICTVAPQHSC